MSNTWGSRHFVIRLNLSRVLELRLTSFYTGR